MLSRAIRIFFASILLVISTMKVLSAQAIVSPGVNKVCSLSNASFQLVSFPSASNFRWQDSTLNGWTNIANNNLFQGVNNDTLFINSANSTINNRKFRCIVDSAGLGLKFDTSNVVQLIVRAQLQKPIIGNSQIVCFGNVPDTLQVMQAASGGDSGFVYQWQKSTNGTTWQNIVNIDSTKLPLDTLSKSLFFRLMATSKAQCGVVVSDSIFIRLVPQIVKPKLFLNKQTVCFGGNADSIVVMFFSSFYNHQWQISSDSINFFDILNDTSNTKFSIQTTTSKLWYRLRSTSIYNCGVVFSDTATVTTYSPISKPSIFGTQTVCFEDVPDTLSITTLSSIGPDVKFQWQSSVNGTNWIDILNAVGKKLALTKNGVTRFYRVKATWPSTCGVRFTDSVLVSVYSEFKAGIIRPNQNICFNSSPATFSFQTVTTGGGDAYTFQWQESIDSLNFINIPGANSTIYQSPAISSTKYFRVRVISTSACGTLFTNIIRVGVYPNFVGPNIVGNDTVCFNSRPDTLRTSTNPIGGNGTYTYQWQNSTNGITWLNIANAFSSKFKPPQLTSNIFYRLISMAGPNCGIDTSNAVFIKVWPNITKPRISNSQSICFNTTADTLRLTQLPTGGNGKFTYQWQSSTNGLTWLDIPGQTTIKMSTGKLTQSAFYRLKAISVFGCSEINSDSIKITVFDELAAGTINGNQTICYNSIPAILNIAINPSGGGSLYNYQWQVSSDSVNFTDITNAKQTTLQLSALTSTKFYRLKINASLGCGSVLSNIIKVKVYDEFVGAKIGDSHKICFGYVPVPLYMTQPAHGGSLAYEYQWQSSIDSINWENINGANAATLPMSVSKITMYYRLINSSTFSCGIDTSNIVEIVALKLPDTTAFVGPSQVCRNQQELFYSLENSKAEYSYEWSISKGRFLSNNTNTGVFISWNDESGIDTIFVKQTNKATLCFNYMKLPIILKSEPAPSKTDIVRKANSNILVCRDTSLGIHYQWGYIEKVNSSYFDIPNANQRYIQLPHTFDTTQYIYYVKTWFTDCITSSYYNFNPTILGFEESKNVEVKIYPNPSTGVFYIDAANLEINNLKCYNILGEEVIFEFNSHSNSIYLNGSLPNGIYLFKLMVGDKSIIRKVILQR